MTGRAAALAGAASGTAGARGRGQGGEDSEHTSSYLVPTDEYFDDERRVVPPVLGA